MKTKIVMLVICFNVLLYLTLATPMTQVPQVPTGPPLPARDQLTTEDVFSRLGKCEVNLDSEKAYVQKLITKIREQEQTIDLLKKGQGRSEKSTTP